MKRVALRTTLAHFDLPRFVVIRECVTLPANTYPQDILGFIAVSHNLDGFVIILAPKDCASESQSNFIDITGVMIGTIHDAAEILAKLLNFGNC
jgi:hypothetical protein